MQQCSVKLFVSLSQEVAMANNQHLKKKLDNFVEERIISGDLPLTTVTLLPGFIHMARGSRCCCNSASQQYAFRFGYCAASLVWVQSFLLPLFLMSRTHLCFDVVPQSFWQFVTGEWSRLVGIFIFIKEKPAHYWCHKMKSGGWRNEIHVGNCRNISDR